MDCSNDQVKDDRKLKELVLFSLASVCKGDVTVLYKYAWKVTNRKGKNNSNKSWHKEKWFKIQHW